MFNFFNIILETKENESDNNDLDLDINDDPEENDGTNDKPEENDGTNDKPEENDGTNDKPEENESDNNDLDLDINDKPEENDGTDDNKQKQNKLIKDFLLIYNIIKHSIDKISNIDKSDVISNKICTQVMLNLTNLKKILYDYIILKFNNNTYVINLYQYNYFIEALKINIKMLQKINVLGNKNKTNI